MTMTTVMMIRIDRLARWLGRYPSELFGLSGEDAVAFDLAVYLAAVGKGTSHDAE